MDEEGTWEGQPDVLRHGGARGKSILREDSIPGFQGDVDYAARQESGAARYPYSSRAGCFV
jgi:hypothetical protein